MRNRQRVDPGDMSPRPGEDVKPGDSPVFRQPWYAAATPEESTAAEFVGDGSPVIEYLVPAGFDRCAELPE